MASPSSPRATSSIADPAPVARIELRKPWARDGTSPSPTTPHSAGGQAVLLHGILRQTGTRAAVYEPMPVPVRTTPVSSPRKPLATGRNKPVPYVKPGPRARGAILSPFTWWGGFTMAIRRTLAAACTALALCAAAQDDYLDSELRARVEALKSAVAAEPTEPWATPACMRVRSPTPADMRDLSRLTRWTAACQARSSSRCLPWLTYHAPARHPC